MSGGNGLLEVRIAAPAADAQRLARLLVDERLAACVQVVPGVVSTFRWDGAVTTAEEQLVVAKTHRSRFEEILDRVGEEHPYETPEIIAVPIVEASAAYAAWLVDEVAAGERS
ncbi:divalent-cation tolerance protein CutA [Knoellia locipacati]|uniref:Divalent ion tolerance protein CutA n=1 Tax=Knoellia locipacati TaxID=882824 RepID=A0A512T067_9MICO|nr:divalent-cation tolerance protein CutA [Knoellia locipacati]GEQ13564.1 divalent ion tolerance protein CutA [Knoellia locipacati]